MPSFFTLIPHFLSGIYKLFEHISVHSFRVPYISGGNTKEMDKKWTENEHIIAIKCVHANYFYVHVAYPYTLEHSVYNFAGIYQNIRKRFTHSYHFLSGGFPTKNLVFRKQKLRKSNKNTVSLYYFTTFRI